jgi:hypothetical protein
MFISIKMYTQHQILVFKNNTLLLNTTPPPFPTNSMIWIFKIYFCKIDVTFATKTHFLFKRLEFLQASSLTNSLD